MTRYHLTSPKEGNLNEDDTRGPSSAISERHCVLHVSKRGRSLPCDGNMSAFRFAVILLFWTCYVVTIVLNALSNSGFRHREHNQRRHSERYGGIEVLQRHLVACYQQHFLEAYFVAAESGIDSSGDSTQRVIHQRKPFQKSPSEVSNKYRTWLTPAGWTFTIWGVIYVWLGLILVYVLSLLWRKNGPVRMFETSPIADPLPLLFLCLNLILNFTWLFLWSQEWLLTSAIVLLLITSSGWIALGAFYISAQEVGRDLREEGKWDLAFIRYIVFNGLETYNAWTSIAFLVNLSIVMTHVFGKSLEASANIPLSLLVVVLALWVPFEATAFDEYGRYGFMQYFVLTFALIGIYSGDNERPLGVTMYIVIIMTLSAVLAVGRIAFIKTRNRSHPQYAQL
ncbi:unnamed protein product [Darwinula stevensoni]|uniref:Uncharacterized protein n=1 Tax=Darwinula stevensoni TaxID=69355 RepID=A0A7R8XD08_9CRUS|nr:unnamed protein product [Darwinula stevensoni]CAG0889337.1 unnamed protein product [Darwinula stevensoni]